MNPDDLDPQECVLTARLAIAQELMAEGNPEEAERLYKQALKQAEAVGGENSPLAGLVLIELFDLYDNQGRDTESKPLWSRIRNIVI